MVIGADTGFFIEYANENATAKEIWDKVSNGEEKLIVSVVSLNEISVYFFRKGAIKEKDELINLVKLMPNVELVPVTAKIAEESAKYKHSLGIPTVDCLILTTFILKGCKEIITTDSQLKKAEEQNLIKVKLIWFCQMFALRKVQAKTKGEIMALIEK